MSYGYVNFLLANAFFHLVNFLLPAASSVGNPVQLIEEKYREQIAREEIVEVIPTCSQFSFFGRPSIKTYFHVVWIE